MSWEKEREKVRVIEREERKREEEAKKWRLYWKYLVNVLKYFCWWAVSGGFDEMSRTYTDSCRCVVYRILNASNKVQ